MIIKNKYKQNKYLNSVKNLKNKILLEKDHCQKYKNNKIKTQNMRKIILLKTKNTIFIKKKHKENLATNTKI